MGLDDSTTVNEAASVVAPPRRQWTQARRWISIVLVVIASLLTAASVLAVWADRTAFVPERFRAVITPALDEPEFYDALADNVSEQTLAALDLDTRVNNRMTQLDALLTAGVTNAVDLPPRLDELLTSANRPTLAALSPGIVDALEQRVRALVDRVLTSNEFRDFVPVLVERAHRAAVALARGDAEDFPNVYLTDDALRLNTIPIITQVLQVALEDLRDWLPDVTLPDVVSERLPEAREQLASALGARIPDDVGQVTLMSRESFDELRQTVARLDRLIVLTLVVTVLMIVAAIAVAPDRRRSVVQLGLGIVATLVLTAALVRRSGARLVEEARSPEGEHVVQTLVGDITSSLRGMMLMVGLLAGGAALIAYLMGRPPWLGSLVRRTPWLNRLDARPTIRWIARYADGLKVGVIAIAVAIAALNGLEWTSLVLAVAIVAVGLWGITSAQRYVATTAPQEPAPMQPAEPDAPAGVGAPAAGTTPSATDTQPIPPPGQA